MRTSVQLRAARSALPRMLRGPVAALVLILHGIACAPSRPAPVAPAPGAPDARRAVVKEFSRGQPIRVETLAAGRVEGAFRRSTIDTLIIGSAGAERTFIIDDVTGLWVRGLATNTGSTAGALILLPVGALFGVGVAVLTDEPASTVRLAWGAVIGAIAGAGVGAFLGSAIGSRFERWHRRYP